MSSVPARTLEIRRVQIARALWAAVAAAIITFTSNHSADVGLAVFGGFALATAVVLAGAAWLSYPPGRRTAAIVISALSLVAGVLALIPALQSVGFFLSVVIVWALATGVVEAVDGWRTRRALRAEGVAASQRLSEARDSLTVGILTIILGLALLLVPGQYALRYYIAEAHQSFTLTGITIAVGIFGGYAAILAVYLGIAAFSPRRETDAVAATSTPASSGFIEEPGARASGTPASDQHSGGAA